MPAPLELSKATPDWRPAWAKQLADSYYSGTTCLFLLHGNVHDLVRYESPAGPKWCNLGEFLASQVFGSWQVVLQHDLGRGLRVAAGPDAARLQGMLRLVTGRLGEVASWPRDPDQTLQLLDRYVERSLLDDPAEPATKIAIVLDYAQYLVPAGDLSSLARGEGARLVKLLSWAQNPYIKRVNIAFCLIADKLSEINDRLVQNPHVAAIEVALPDRGDRLDFIRSTLAETAKTSPATTPVAPDNQLSPERLADVSSGLSLVSLNVLLSQAKRADQGIEQLGFRRLKKTLIERQCQGLVEFVEPSHTLEMIVGHEAGIQRLREDARYVARGEFDAAPMGYLICGPVGTGKTFLAECYAGEIGIPCVKLRNFRSKYVGETEGNLEQVLNVLRSLGPVVVIIDEADASLGNRRADGDSGTSSRVFSMIASQMGDTRYRGKILWMLLTCRPDLLPIDLKRQGRAEVHIPLFYPATPEENVAMFRQMAKKNKVDLPDGDLPVIPPEKRLSGADIESVVLSAKRLALAENRAQVSRADLERSLNEFIPSAQGLEKELQELAAVLECSQQAFLTDEWRAEISRPNGRARLQERMVAVRQLVEN